jgi:hypothetical protein
MFLVILRMVEHKEEAAQARRMEELVLTYKEELLQGLLHIVAEGEVVDSMEVVQDQVVEQEGPLVAEGEAHPGGVVIVQLDPLQPMVVVHQDKQMGISRPLKLKAPSQIHSSHT